MVNKTKTIIDLKLLDDDKLSQKEYLDIIDQLKIKKNIQYSVYDIIDRLKETIEDQEEDYEFKTFNREYITKLKLFLEQIKTYNTNSIEFRYY